MDLEAGSAHDQHFASNNLGEDKRSAFASLVQEGSWRWTNTEAELKGRLKQHKYVPSKPTALASGADIGTSDGGLPHAAYPLFKPN